MPSIPRADRRSNLPVTINQEKRLVVDDWLRHAGVQPPVFNTGITLCFDGPLQIEARIDQNAQLSGQFSLWNQQGSRVVRGHLLVIPIGRSLLYVEPIYLRAESSPMPELRLVVLATQERLAYGASFEEALKSLFGEVAQATPDQKTDQKTEPKGQPKPDTSPPPSPTPQNLGATNTQQQLIMRAIQEFEEYQRLTAEGKLSEAGKKLEDHKRTLEELRKATGKQP